MAAPAHSGEMGEPLSVLVLGGNGMIGLPISRRLALIAASAGLGEVTAISRGSVYWGQQLPEGVRPLRCARRKLHRRVRELLQSDEQSFAFVRGGVHAVIDCSGYKAPHVRDSLEALALLDSSSSSSSARTFYVYLSSDSVYDVSVPAEAAVDASVRFSVEADAVRPSDDKLRRRLARRDSYGHKKMEGEEVLVQCCQNFVALRLADVLGPLDNTDRWINYMLWLLASDLVPGLAVHLPRSAQHRRLSLVFSHDVADMAVRLACNTDGIRERVEAAVLEAGAEQTETAQAARAFNLAMSETPTLRELLIAMAEELGCAETARFVETEDAAATTFLPSVERGPIDISKAQHVLGWQPTPLPEALRVSLRFYAQELLAASPTAMTAADEFLRDEMEVGAHTLSAAQLVDMLRPRLERVAAA